MRQRRRASEHVAETPIAGTAADAVLVAAAQADGVAFAHLFDRYWEAVFRFCYYRLGDWPEAEDAASQVFTNAFAALPRFRPAEHDDAFRSWLFTIAYRIVSNARRRHGRHRDRPLDERLDWVDPTPSPEETALAMDDHRRLYLLLAELPPEQRELLELRLAGLTAVEIARVLGRSHDAIRAAESRAVKRLRAFAMAFEPAGERAHG